ncbi:MFS transporter [Streptomyces sp. NPDC057257]|uniref:MFS transporter n=1 Tax=Streptomyces sp. NPDC057257 TaxID=3346071 RepID=UPI00362B7FCC
MIAGLLPQVGRDLDVSEAAAGRLISGYALAVAVGAIALTAATARLHRKTVLTGLVTLFVTGNLLSAIAPTYPVMLLGRVVAALCHGSFFGIGSLVARRLVPPERASRAVALMFAGLTVANVVGVPFGALIGEHWGWRATFWSITAIGLAALIAITTLIPPWAGTTPTAPGAGDGPTAQGFRDGPMVPGPEDGPTAPGSGNGPTAPTPGDGLRPQLQAAFRSRQVWLTLTDTALGYGGMFGAFSYLAYTFTEVTGFSPADLPWLLVVYGTGLVAGNMAGGRGADHNRDATLIASLAALTATLTLFGLLADSRPAAVPLLFLLGLSGFASVPGMITRVTDEAAGVPLAASANVSASNIGNAVGAWLGGLTISTGLGYRAPLYAGATLTATALAVMTYAAHTSHRRP